MIFAPSSKHSEIDRTPSDAPVRDVPMGKIKANALSESIATLIKGGMSKAPLVEKFFAQWHDETLEDASRRHSAPNTRDCAIYTRQTRFSPNFKHGREDETEGRLSMRWQSTVIAYYFESCDIYEAPKEVIS